MTHFGSVIALQGPRNGLSGARAPRRALPPPAGDRPARTGRRGSRLYRAAGTRRGNLVDLGGAMIVRPGGARMAEDAAGNVSAEELAGRWTHVAAGGRTLHGDIDRVICRRDGGNPEYPTAQFPIAQFEGSGTFDGREVNFLITAQDHGEPGDDDRYRILIADSDDTVVYAIAGIMNSGYFQIDPANEGHP